MINSAIVWTEPELRFKLGIQETIIDPKVGLSLHGPLDFNTKRRRFSEIRLGVICKEPLRIISFLKKLNSSFQEKKVGDKKYKGFETIYKVPIRIPSESEVVQLTDSEINSLYKVWTGNTLKEIVQLYDNKIQEFHDEMRGKYDILVIQIPKELEKYYLRSFIKVLAIKRGMVTQIITEKTLSSQYVCENMWNLSLGLYVKAGGVPWQLKDFTDTKSFIGIAYGIKKLQNGQIVFSGLAEIFNEFGEHVSVVSVSSKAFKEDFTLETDGSYHLSRKKIAVLIRKLIEEYQQKIGNPPEKVVLHKTTFFNTSEREGVKDALSEFEITYDLVNVIKNPSLRFFTNEKNPPSRGTFYKFNDSTGLLYTTGYVGSLGTYPGVGIPKPLEFHRDEGITGIEKLGKEILALTKMDWNNTNIMLREPVTIKYASKIVEILKAGLQPDEVVKDIRYYI
ncbi:MAG: argonaute/piwi family protein [Thermoproteota archaeon]